MSATLAAAPDRALRETAENEVLRARRKDTILRLSLGAGFPIGVLLLWQIAALAGFIDERFFPSPLRIISVGAEIVSTPSEGLVVLHDIGATLARALGGYALGAIAGVGIGACMGLYKPFRYALAPSIYATFPTPKLAVFPLLIVIFGLGDSSKTALVTLGVFFMTCMSTFSGVLYANPIYRDLAIAYKIPIFAQWRRIILPSALPSIVTGLKLGIGQALILVVSSEFVSSNDGIGYYIWNSWQILDIPRMFIGLVVVSAIGGAAIALSNALERWLIPWAKTR